MKPKVLKENTGENFTTLGLAMIDMSTKSTSTEQRTVKWTGIKPTKLQHSKENNENNEKSGTGKKII